MILALALACAPQQAEWFGTVARDGQAPIPWEAAPMVELPAWDGSLENRIFSAGGWIHDPVEGPLYAQAAFEVHSQNGTPWGPVDPPNTNEVLPILTFGEDTRDHDWWVYVSWVEEDPAGEIVMRYVFNNSGGTATGGLNIDGLFTDPDTGELGWTGRVDLQITLDAQDDRGPAQREVAYTFFWGTFPAGAAASERSSTR